MGKGEISYEKYAHEICVRIENLVASYIFIHMKSITFFWTLISLIWRSEQVIFYLIVAFIEMKCDTYFLDLKNT